MDGYGGIRSPWFNAEDKVPLLFIKYWSSSIEKINEFCSPNGLGEMANH